MFQMHYFCSKIPKYVFHNFMDKMSYSFSVLWFGTFVEIGRGQVKNPEKKVLNQHEMLFLAPSMLVKGCFKLLLFGRVIFFLVVL